MHGYMDTWIQVVKPVSQRVVSCKRGIRNLPRTGLDRLSAQSRRSSTNICYAGVITLVPVDCNINSQKHTQILDAYLWPVVAESFGDKLLIFQDDCAPAQSSKFTRDWKITNEIPGMTYWPAQYPDLNIIENVWRIIQLKLQSENEVITRRPLSRERSYPCQCIGTTRKAIDCAITLLLTFFI